jgi:hypothetical protein
MSSKVRGFSGVFLEKDGKTLKSPMKGAKQVLTVPIHLVVQAVKMMRAPNHIPILSKSSELSIEYMIYEDTLNSGNQ